MPTKKQRRRLQKTRRHDYEFVYLDDEGNEVEVEPSDRPEKQKGKSEARARTPNKKGSGATRTSSREIQPPSWRRALRRAVIWAPVLVVVMMLLNRNVSPVQWLTSAVFLIAFFIPISYFTDSMAYRVYRKRLDAAKR